MDGSQSVCLESRYVIVKFAAGNLFSGRFGDLIGTSGGTVYFGRPFTARPTGLRLWVKYSGGKVNRVGNAPSDMIKEGDYDRANIRIAIGNRDYKKYGGDAESPILANTTDGEKIIQSDAANSTNVWQQITIPLDYKTTSRFPTHIVVSCAASMYGDYFTGYDNSMLWVDGFELLYE